MLFSSESKRETTRLYADDEAVEPELYQTSTTGACPTG